MEKECTRVLMVESNSISDNQIVDRFIEGLFRDKGIEIKYNCKIERERNNDTVDLIDQEGNRVDYDYLCMTMEDEYYFPYDQFTDHSNQFY